MGARGGKPKAGGKHRSGAKREAGSKRKTGTKHGSGAKHGTKTKIGATRKAGAKHGAKMKTGAKRKAGAKHGAKTKTGAKRKTGAKHGAKTKTGGGGRSGAKREAGGKRKVWAKRATGAKQAVGSKRKTGAKHDSKMKTGGGGGGASPARLSAAAQAGDAKQAKADPRGERIQKILARAGLGSRRGCEEIILEGRVRVNGRVVMELGTRADASRDTITVGGKRVRGETLKYYAINKPKGVISTTAEDEFARGGRRRVIDLVPERPRVKPVGRLDVESEGLMLLTNDGDLANRLTHPRHGIERVYRAEVKGEMTEDALARLRRGVRLAEGRTLPPKVRVIHKGASRGVLEVIIKEGLNREVRRILAAVGLKVKSLKRIRLGPLSLGSLPSGTARELSAPELARLRKATSGPGEPPPPWLRRRRRRGAAPQREGRPRGK
ncbi:MAG: pseudouridine synthase [Planctomycetota bacterium]|jgi:23S rRNA pseudouridine2605 synthase